MNEQPAVEQTPKEPRVCGKMIRLTVGGKAYWINIDHLISVEPPPAHYSGGSWITSGESVQFWAAESADEVVSLVRTASPPDLATIAMLEVFKKPVSSPGNCGDSQADGSVTR